MTDKECCSTCEFKCTLEKFDYSGKGCKHSIQEGFACDCFINEDRVVVWMVGNNPENGLCECYSPIMKYEGENDG